MATGIRSCGRRLRRLVWAEPDDEFERRLLRKADWLILPYLCLTADLCRLPIQISIESIVALKMHGSQYNNVLAFFTAGYAIAMIPQNMLLLAFRPRVLFPINGFIWGMLTAVSAAATKVEHLYAIKFFQNWREALRSLTLKSNQGMAEASTFVGAHYILGAWYKPHEIGRRAAIFSIAGQAATLFSGPMQTALYHNLNGKHGIAGWQWLFIVCGLITIPITLAGIFLLPDTPATTRTRLLTAEERAYAAARVGARDRTPVNTSLLRRLFGRWEIWVFSLLWIAGGAIESHAAWGIMTLWMRAQRTALLHPLYSIDQLNHYPLGIAGVAILALFVTSIWTDRRTKDRFAVNLFTASCALVSASIVLHGGLHPDAYPRGVYFFAFYLSGATFAGQASNFSWANELLAHDEQARTIVLATMNVASYAFNAWFQVVFFKASYAPKFQKGSSLIIAFCVLLAIFTCTARFFQLRDERRAPREARTLDLRAEDEGAKDSKQDDDLEPGMTSTISRG
ncbi:hypothetical protein BMF94_0431 [Rhodotorula taiwanensis]|uniref:Major facilitator superfamily (MFS) profile domain-containing protein n=1 Tax=Rhodotorula taiwanensis TaxID=741276 RepID=A0A2S5BHI5_9BASI|nr:hypothetical protein BMF94_0431 [Rhodotorula taiwanensis]